MNTNIYSAAQQSAFKCFKQRQDFTLVRSQSFQHNNALICPCVIEGCVRIVHKMKPPLSCPHITYFPHRNRTYQDDNVCVSEGHLLGGGIGRQNDILWACQHLTAFSRSRILSSIMKPPASRPALYSWNKHCSYLIFVNSSLRVPVNSGCPRTTGAALAPLLISTQ